jgi:hypothetical protein
VFLDKGRRLCPCFPGMNCRSWKLMSRFRTFNTHCAEFQSSALVASSPNHFSCFGSEHGERFIDLKDEECVALGVTAAERDELASGRELEAVLEVLVGWRNSASAIVAAMRRTVVARAPSDLSSPGWGRSGPSGALASKVSQSAACCSASCSAARVSISSFVRVVETISAPRTLGCRGCGHRASGCSPRRPPGRAAPPPAARGPPQASCPCRRRASGRRAARSRRSPAAAVRRRDGREHAVGDFLQAVVLRSANPTTVPGQRASGTRSPAAAA